MRLIVGTIGIFQIRRCKLFLSLLLLLLLYPNGLDGNIGCQGKVQT